MMNRKQIIKLFSWIFVVCFVIMSVSVTILSSIQQDLEVSYSESRKLSQFSVPTLKTLSSGEWFSDFEQYCKDQIVGREQWIKTYYKLQDELQVNERNGFVLGKNFFVLPINDVSDDMCEDSLDYGKKQIETLLDIKSVTDKTGGLLLYVNIPSKADLFSENYPVLYYNRQEQNETERISIIEKAKSANIETVETHEILSAHKDEYIYYATDHHFTIKGAYYVYQAILDKINNLETGKEKLVFPDWEQLNVYKNTARMAGSYLRKWGDAHTISVDNMEYALPYDMPQFTRTDNGVQKEMPTLFNKDGSDYTSFMGGDIGNTIVDTGRDDLPSVLYIGFSFTNTLEVLSVYNFNKVESLDPRHWEGNICTYIEESRPDYVIVVRDDIYRENPQFKCTVR